MSPARLVLLTALALIAFAGNSLLCRLALGETAIDAASFTTIRLAAGAVTLWGIASLRAVPDAGRGSWRSALALFTYAAAFSFAYVTLTAATGALLLFGSVQATMICIGLRGGERMTPLQWTGFLIAIAGLAGLLFPGISSPPLAGSALMIGAGIAWGFYSLHGSGKGDPLRVTAGNFLRAVPFALALSIIMSGNAAVDVAGAGYAAASGAVTSGIGYAIWYSALPSLKAMQAATLQLSVPVIAAAGAIAFLGESLSGRFVLASTTILGGIAIVILARPVQRRAAEPAGNTEQPQS